MSYKKARRRNRKRRARRISILFIFIIIAVIAVAAILLYASLFRQQQILNTQAELIRDIDLEEQYIDQELYSSGNCMIAEMYMKTYISDYQQKLLEFDSLMNDEMLAAMLGIENIQSDGPAFEESTAYLEEKRDTIEAMYEELIYMGTEESITEAIEQDGAEEIIIELYEEAMLDTIGLGIYKSEEELSQSEEAMLERLDNIEAVISFLRDNADYWAVEEGVIFFTENSYLEEYQSLTAQISD